MLSKRMGMAALVALALGGCASPGVYDEVYLEGSHVAGGVAAGVDAPVGFVASSWAAPHERAAEDITLADFPGFAFGIVDPFNVLPPPVGTFYVPWKLMVTVIRAFPFVTYSEAGEGGGEITWVSGRHPGPLWYAVGPAIETIDVHMIPVRETVAGDHSPVPGDGTFGSYWSHRFNAHIHNFEHAGYTMKWAFLGANSDQPPYDRYFPDHIDRSKTNIHKTFDLFLFNYDWDDPYIN